jgi:superfamily II DNA helicase RecQ
MQLKVFVLPVKNLGAAEGEMNVFLRGHRVLAVKKEFVVFSRLRDWRKGVSEKEGAPVYTIFTNEQLAQMVQKEVRSKAALKEIEGVGEARLEKYGEAVVQLLASPVKA